MWSWRWLDRILLHLPSGHSSVSLYPLFVFVLNGPRCVVFFFGHSSVSFYLLFVCILNVPECFSLWPKLLVKRGFGVGKYDIRVRVVVVARVVVVVARVVIVNPRFSHFSWWTLREIRIKTVPFRKIILSSGAKIGNSILPNSDGALRPGSLKFYHLIYIIPLLDLFYCRFRVQ